MPGQVTLDSDGAIAVVLLSHPGKLGAMSRGMWRELKAVFERIQREPRWRCVLVRGDPGAFCAGGDIAEYPGFRFDPAQLRDFHEQDVWGALRAMLDCDVPMVAQIEGACMGAGMEIASCCDIRVAGAGAKFGAPIARLGFPMAPREAQLVASVAGAATAREMLLQAAVLDAAEMKSRGFLHQVLADAEVASHARQRCERIAALAPEAARMNKRTLRALAAGGMPPDAYDYAPGAEHREGIAAFLDKRQPVF
ncbi:MAG: enoyl-CoA hydratase/isomerase family protein [Pseudomonadota bacterium]